MPDRASALSAMQVIHTGEAIEDVAPSTASAPSYIHRGDWEPPDVLLLVEYAKWQESIDSIIAAARTDMTPVYILMNRDDEQYRENILQAEQDSNNTLLHLSLDTPWIRDYGPLQLKARNGSVKWIDFAYSNQRTHDDSVPEELAGYMGASIEDGDYFLDGGAVISNGSGLCAITDKSLEIASVDPFHIEEFEGFRDILGCKALAVLPALTGESTGHADIIAQFLSPEIVAVAQVNQEDTYGIAAELEQAIELLKETAENISQPLRVIRLQLIVEADFFYSYINGTRLKKTYLIPSFHNVPSEIEQTAIHVLQSALPDIELSSIPAETMVKSGGAVHCITLGLNLPDTTDEIQFWVKKTRIALSSDSILFN
jgi:agmatine deiminase